MSIFDKDCPECAATLATDAACCACGYVFEPFRSEDLLLALERAIQEEKLFEKYLAGRVKQAAEVARVAATIAAMEPENERRAVEAARANRAAKVAQIEVIVQQARVAQAQLTAQRLHAAQAANAAKTGPAVQGAQPPRPCERGAAEKVHLVAAKMAREQLGAAQVAGEKLSKEYLAASAEKGAEAAVQAAESWQTSVAAQASQAAESMNPAAAQQQIRLAVKSLRATESKERGPAFRATQTAKTAGAVAAAEALDTMECPWCTVTLPASVARCRCGWSTPVPLRQIPSLTPSAGERAAIAKGLEVKKGR